MRAAVARRGVLVVEDVADPVPGPGDALVAVKACGICGSDLHALHHADEFVAIAREMAAPLTFDPRRDFIMGHEFTAEVLELGPQTEGSPVGPGDLVTSLPSLDVSQPLPEAPWFPKGARWSARRVFLHLVAEIAQHAGHADIIRESLDGQKSMG